MDTEFTGLRQDCDLISIGIVAVDMESAAIAKVANINNVPCVVIRAISDELIEKKEKYAFSEHDVANFSADVLVDVLLNIELK